MTQPAFKWSRVLALTALLVVTAGLAAAPVRDAWLPLAARPFASWSPSSVMTRPAAAVPALPSTVSTQWVDLDATLVTAPDRLALRAATAASADSGGSQARVSAQFEEWSSREINRRGAAAGGSSVRWSGRPGEFTRPGALVAAPGGGGSGARSASGTTPAGGSGSSNRTSGSGTISVSSGSGATSAAGSAAIATTAAAGSTAAALFTEHTAGLSELTGNRKNHKGGSHGGNGNGKGHGGGGHGGGSGRPTVASQPEPSTMLLFGTGLAAVAGAVRRRLRR